MRLSSLSLFALASLLVAACGSSTEGSGSSSSSSSGGSGSGGSGSSGSGSSSSGSSGSSVQCTGTTPSFPTFDKRCSSAADCVVKLHMINCCGTRIAIGINASQAAAFDAAEATCEAMYPGCGCATQPTKAEDGKESTDDSAIAVDCKAEGCSTYIP